MDATQLTERLAFPRITGRLPLLTLLVFLALAVGPPDSGASVRIHAEVRADAPGKLGLEASGPRGIDRVVFYVDGQRRWVDNSPRWRYGNRGYLTAAHMQPGPHRVTSEARLRDGRTSRATRTVYLTRGAAGEGRRWLISKPVTAGGRALYRGDFDLGFDDWHVQSIPARATLIEGPTGKYARFEVREGDVEPATGSQRSEVSGPTFDEGQDLFIRDSIRVPSSDSYSGPWQIIQQLHETNWSGSPGVAVFLDASRTLKIAAGDGSQTYWNGPKLDADRFYDLVYRVKLSQDPTVGFVEVWLDGVNQGRRVYGSTLQTAGTYLKAGVYRSKSSVGTSIVEHDNLIVGTSLDAVMG